MSEMPRTIGRYRILAELGRGAMGVVYGAEDPLLSRKVAIKTILMSSDAAERAEYEPRFYQEAKTAAGLSHPNIVTIYDMGREGDLAFMAMELVEGVELKSLMSTGRLTVARSLDIAAQVAEGIAYAHERGVVHRDIKPGNVMVSRNDQAKIMDFGIARVKTSDVKTRTGMMLGSPKYMSPEQIIGRAIDPRADIFSLGVLIYEMVAGEPPFAGPDLPALMHAITSSAPVPLMRHDPRLPPMIDLILAKALAKKPESRYQNARELAADLRACRELLPVAVQGGVPADRGAAPAHADSTWPDAGTHIMAPPVIMPPMPSGAPHDSTTQVGWEAPSPAPGLLAGMDPSERSFGSTMPMGETTILRRPPGVDPGAQTSTLERFIVSSRFDSTATLMRLRHPDHSATNSRRFDETFSGSARRLRKSPERVVVAVAVVVALVLAVVIALM
ncbi:MAG TPA: serine/threonine-protein kinase [Burkholderiales bacterium]|jgi:serine/threonine-protein kinase